MGQVFNTGEKTGFIRALYKEGMYEGQYSEGELNGYGRAISMYGHYQGYFKDGKYNGRGVFTPNKGQP